MLDLLAKPDAGFNQSYASKLPNRTDFIMCYLSSYEKKRICCAVPDAGKKLPGELKKTFDLIKFYSA